MSLDLSALSSATLTAQTLANLILVSPEDKGIRPEVITGDPIDSKKFLFDFYGEQSVALHSEITNHFVEDNTSLQDHIALPPESIRGAGFIGELKDFIPGVPNAVNIAEQKLALLSAYTPGLSTTALLVLANAQQLAQLAILAKNNAVSTWGSLAGTAGTNKGNAVFGAVQNKQQIAFQQFYGYWKDRTLFTVQTPWAIFKHCAIESLMAVQGADTNAISTFEISFKPINFARTSFVDVNGNADFYGGRAGNQASESNPISSSPSAGQLVTGPDAPDPTKVYR